MLDRSHFEVDCLMDIPLKTLKSITSDYYEMDGKRVIGLSRMKKQDVIDFLVNDDNGCGLIDWFIEHYNEVYKELCETIQIGTRFRYRKSLYEVIGFTDDGRGMRCNLIVSDLVIRRTTLRIDIRLIDIL